MSNAYRVSCPQPRLKGHIVLESSKSISNRALIIRSLAEKPFEIKRISQSDDTVALQKMLASDAETLYSGHAGSSYRFMVARACLGNKEVKLDGSIQLRKRPIGPLVKALQSLGADITYLEKEGFPPLLIKPSKDLGVKSNEVNIQAGVSSQYVTALLLIAPYLPNGIKINLIGDPVSIPYIRMTLQIMQWFGVEHTWEEKTITVSPGKYIAKDYAVEGDWSAASYYYSLAALSEVADIEIDGLNENSLQGDAIVKDIYALFGVETHFTENGIRIVKSKNAPRPTELKYDFSKYPDLAQTVMVTVAGFGIKGLLSGLNTLRIKETDRLLAMQTELARVKVKLDIVSSKGDFACIITGKAKWKDKAKFNTYEDHRMAMAFTPLACLAPIIIKEPQVVTKSYPSFWEDMEKVGVKRERAKL